MADRYRDREGFGGYREPAWRGGEDIGEPRWRGSDADRDYGDRYERDRDVGTAWPGRSFAGGRGRSEGEGYGSRRWLGREAGYGPERGISVEPGRVEPGRYRGVGPRGYQRSDDRICEDVCERLTDAGDIDASELEVDAQGGVVTLRGTVRRALAEAASRGHRRGRLRRA